ncbi:YTH domain-containing protein ECT4 isoform X1 [Dendrobium catenatum]|uniref:YTH domain-containing family protein n=1 Tax=Dendrobium catenatum TaxID=906689 RepID=A0A2I0VZU3_9ASPA|nr:YTH domain-containing protein ECT4 isoform X1 [Dendrobium catenatum]XP_028554992.1 YTH domain-containing protein ECT4 isoform X1 [Dendrobium catenatum]PKU68926.1 Cleavage and polyadenylation specificity factor CPSF30 [Dendrobium catenatum]
MAAVASAADQATELLKKLTMEPKNKTQEGHDVAMKPSGIQYGSANGVEAPKFQMPLSERSVTPVLPEYVDHNICCYLPNGYPSTAYYYGAYDGSVNDWDYSRYTEGLEVAHGVYSDMYHHGYGYAPYSAYHSSGSPVPSMGHDGHIYGAQHYQYPSPYFQPQTDMNGTYSSNISATQADVNATAVADKPTAIVESVKSNSTEVNNGNANGFKDFVPLKQRQQNSQLTSNGTYGSGVLVGGHPPSGYQDPRFSYDGIRSPNSWFDGPAFSDPYARSTTPNASFLAAPHNSNLESSRNHNARSVPQLMGFNATRPTTPMGPAAHGIMNRMYPANQMYGHCANAYRPGFGFGSNMYDSRMNDRWGMSFDGKYKPRGRGNGFYGYGNENLDGLSELNRGPRANRFKNYKGPVSEDPSVVPDREQYNRADFSDRYSEANFFVIKSYSEDDIHKSIKYNVWASTPNGNKKLDVAYKEAKDKGVECPVFLFFSVNTSGQFIGVAEMVGPVDFNKTVDYWQQDKWNGCFNVKWHIVKDVPNSILKHIIIENNDNKPVTNSRDTQEVKLEQGLQMLKIFKEHTSKTSILDDFGFYEARQKVMQEKRSKPQLLLKPMVEVKLANPVDEKGKDGSNVNGGLQKPSESVTVLKKEAVSVDLGEQKQCDDDCLQPVDGDSDAPKGVNSVAEKRMVSNGTVNGC